MTQDPVQKAIDMLHLLEPEVREQVLTRMPDDVRERIRQRLATMPDGRPHASFTDDVTSRRQLLRETAERVHTRRIHGADQAADVSTPAAGMTAGAAHGVPNAAARPATHSEPANPLSRLRAVHPAAIARAMQGERAEAWALVLDAIDEPSRQALARFLEPAARTAIRAARERQASLSPALRETVERAVISTVVPRALREHHMLLTSNQPEHHHGAAV